METDSDSDCQIIDPPAGRKRRDLPLRRARPDYFPLEPYPDLMEPEDYENYRLQKIRDCAKEFGFDNLFDVALAEATTGRENQKRAFYAKGGYDKFSASFKSYMPPTPEPEPEPEVD